MSAEDKLTQLYLAFIAFISQDFESFLVQFKSDTMLIHLLYPKMEELIFNLMSRFIGRDKLYTNIDYLSCVKGIKELLDVDILHKIS